MKTINFSPTSTASILPFESFKQLALMTVDALTKKTVAISGGSTYAKLFEHWLALKPDCRNTAFFPVDERIVPFEDPQSNWGTACKAFFYPLGRDDARENVSLSASEFLEILRACFGSGKIVFDTVFLGVGDDGHTASLFPGTAFLKDLESPVLQTLSPKPPPQRITLGPSVIRDAREVVTIIAGRGKKPIFEGILKNDASLPIVQMLSLRAKSLLYVEENLI